MLKPGKIYFQILRRDIPGDDSQRVKLWFDQYDRLNNTIKSVIGGILPHGFDSEFTLDEYILWRDAAKLRGLDCGAAWGVSNTSNAKQRGEHYGYIAQQGNAVSTVLDIETASWEGSTAPQAARDLLAAFRRIAPRRNLVCQTWHIPTVHRGVPYAIFQTQCDYFSSMDYYNSFNGSNRYWINNGWIKESWGELQKTELAPDRARRAVLPRISTIQAYQWGDILTSLVSCLCDASAGAIIMWEQQTVNVQPDWWIQTPTLVGIERYAALVERGFVGSTAVFDFQASTDTLVIDGLCGPATAAALGVP